jgi:outer membrane lipoprotein-sorting protein
LFYGDSDNNGVKCVVIKAVNSEKELQLWIDKETNLPHMMLITKLDNSGDSYEAVFSNWRINPNLPDMLFEFEPPSNSTRVKLTPKN